MFVHGFGRRLQDREPMIQTGSWTLDIGTQRSWIPPSAFTSETFPSVHFIPH